MKRKPGTTITSIMIALLMMITGGLTLSVDSGEMKPDQEVKREMVRKQQNQRITPEKRKIAAEALKAERVKVFKARQSQQTMPSTTDTN